MPLIIVPGAGPGVRNSTFGSFTNLSGIPHSLTKAQGMPGGWDIAETGYREHFSQDTTSADMVWKGPWTNRFAFIDWVMGYSQGIVSASQGVITRIIPIQHPEMPWLYAQDMELVDAKGVAYRSIYSQALNYDNTPLMQPVPVTLPAPQPPPPSGATQAPVLLPMVAYADQKSAALDDGLAYYRVHYEQLNYEVREDNDSSVAQFGELARYVSRRVSYTIQALNMNTLASGQLKFIEGPYGPVPGPAIAIPEGGIFLIPTQQLVYTWHDVPDVPAASLALCVGTTNANAFDGVTSAYAPAGTPGYPSYPPGTLLCQPPVIRRTRNRAGRVSWEIEYHFDYRANLIGPGAGSASGTPGGWNAFPCSNGNFYRAQFATSGQYVYQSSNWAGLFQPPLPSVYQ